jgi:hypothetical protein
MSKKQIFGFCVYTITKSSNLKKREQKNRIEPITEQKNWVTAKRLLAEARQNNKEMIIIFAAAEDTRHLIYWAKLNRVKIESDENDKLTTTYWFSDLTPFSAPLPRKTSLILKQSGKPVSKGFIRPYAICRTTKLLLDKIK